MWREVKKFQKNGFLLLATCAFYSAQASRGLNQKKGYALKKGGESFRSPPLLVFSGFLSVPSGVLVFVC
jgi:hypothetical protein